MQKTEFRKANRVIKEHSLSPVSNLYPTHTHTDTHTDTHTHTHIHTHMTSIQKWPGLDVFNTMLGQIWKIITAIPSSHTNLQNYRKELEVTNELF